MKKQMTQNTILLWYYVVKQWDIDSTQYPTLTGKSKRSNGSSTEATEEMKTLIWTAYTKEVQIRLSPCLFHEMAVVSNYPLLGSAENGFFVKRQTRSLPRSERKTCSSTRKISLPPKTDNASRNGPIIFFKTKRGWTNMTYNINPLLNLKTSSPSSNHKNQLENKALLRWQRQARVALWRIAGFSKEEVQETLRISYWNGQYNVCLGWLERNGLPYIRGIVLVVGRASCHAIYTEETKQHLTSINKPLVIRWLVEHEVLTEGDFSSESAPPRAVRTLKEICLKTCHGRWNSLQNRQVWTVPPIGHRGQQLEYRWPWCMSNSVFHFIVWKKSSFINPPNKTH